MRAPPRQHRRKPTHHKHLLVLLSGSPQLLLSHEPYGVGEAGSREQDITP
jgi:hypothetical protein